MHRQVRTATTLRILIAHRGLLTQRDEVADLCETVAGAVETGVPPDVELELTDIRYRYRATVQDGSLRLVPVGRLWPMRSYTGYDIALVHEPIPLVHLALGLVLRLRGTTVVHQPINMLSASYRSGSWFAPRSWLYRAVRPILVGLTGAAWRVVADAFLCVSCQEIEDSGLPPERCRVLRWPTPPTGLAAATFGSVPDRQRSPDAPIAFVNRFDWHRKGFDRLCDWLERCAEELPRPAVLLLAPPTAEVPERLARMIDRRLIEWNPTASGAALLAELARCRALLLLSRYDGQSRVLREAALAGVPTVSTVDSHFAEVIPQLGCGLVIPGDDPEALHTAFDAVANHTCSVDIARKVFDRGPIGTEMLDLLRSLHDRAGESVPA